MIYSTIPLSFVMMITIRFFNDIYVSLIGVYICNKSPARSHVVVRWIFHQATTESSNKLSHS